MKLFATILIAALLLSISCSKSTIQGKPDYKGLSINGRWKYYQSFSSPGNGFIYTSTENLKQWIDFGADGSFESNMPQFDKVTKYEAVDSSRLKFIAPAPQPSAHLYYVQLDSASNTLTISSAEYICIEGCGDKFKR